MFLTKKSIDALAPTGRDQIFWDDRLTGFGLRQSAGGRRTFVIQYRNAQGRSRRFTISNHGRLTADQARKEAKRLLGEVALGHDPREQRKQDRRAPTVSQLCTEYFDKARLGLVISRGGRKKKPSTLYTDEGRAKRHVMPLLGEKLVQDVTTKDIRSFIEAVTLGKTAGVFKTEKPRGKAVVKGGEGAARRTTAMLSAIFAYAVKVGYCTVNPCQGVERTLDKRRSVRLSPEAYMRFGQSITQAEKNGAHWQFCDLARLIALTGLRRNEATRLRVEEIDFLHRCLRLEDTKTGASIRPLGEPALALLRGIIRPAPLGFGPHCVGGLCDIPPQLGNDPNTSFVLRGGGGPHLLGVI